MFGSSALEFAIGMAFVYLMLSLAVTALQEGLASIFRRRARTLKSGLNNLLRETDLVDKIYSHPLIQSLHSSSRPPSYIPSRMFALALLDRLTPTGQLPDQVTVKSALEKDKRHVSDALKLLMADANGNYDRFVENVEVWFNHGMERVSGWYKRYTQGILVALAIPMTMMVNADSLDIGCTVWKDPTVRAALVAEAQHVDASPPPPPVEPEELKDVLANVDAYVGSLRSVRLPVGWSTAPVGLSSQEQENLQAATTQLTGCRTAGPRPTTMAGWANEWGKHWLGWLITVLAISLGSPFWFDLLNKFMAIRGGGRSPDEAPKSPKQEQPALGPGERPREARWLDARRAR
jgi:hypothetical protein